MISENLQSMPKTVGTKPKKNILLRLRHVKEIFRAWAQNVDINCCTKIIDQPNHKVQLIWLVILLGSTGATFYFISKSILDYLNFDIVSQTNIVTEASASFPTITFCDNNQFSTQMSQQLLENIAAENKISNMNSKWATLTLLANLKASLLSDDERKKLGFGWHQIRSCTYALRDCLNELHWFWLFGYGNCWQFNAGKNLTNQKISSKQISYKGREFGLFVEVFPLYNNNAYVTSTSTGMVVFVHNSSFKPPKTGVYIEPGKAAFIEVKNVNMCYKKLYHDQNQTKNCVHILCSEIRLHFKKDRILISQNYFVF